MKTLLIGSLPFLDSEYAIDFALSFSVPTLATLPCLHKSEFMLSQFRVFYESDSPDMNALFSLYERFKLRMALTGHKSFKWQLMGPFSAFHFYANSKIDVKVFYKTYKERLLTLLEQCRADFPSCSTLYFCMDEPALGLRPFEDKHAEFFQALLSDLKMANSDLRFCLHSCARPSLDLIKSFDFDYYLLDSFLYEGREWAAFQHDLRERLAYTFIDQNGHRNDRPCAHEVFRAPSCGLALVKDEAINFQDLPS